jgi:predicted aspartyl protease
MLCIAALAAFVCATVPPYPVQAAPAPAAADPAATVLLAKHREYVGWENGDGAIKTLREQGEAVRDGQTVRRFRALKLGLIYHTSTEYRYGSFDQGFTGRVFWQSNANGFTVQTVGEAARYLIAHLIVASEAFSSIPGTVQRRETIDGVPAVVVRVAPENAFPIDLAIDPTTGALKRYVIDPGGKYEDAQDILDYTEVGGGKRVVSSWRATGGKTLFRYTDIVANAPVSTDELHPPKQVATWTFGPPTQTVPIEVTEHRIFFEAIVNGHRGRFILDTGAGQTALTDSFARTVGAQRVGVTGVHGIGGSAPANVYRVDTIALGGNVLHNVVVATGLDETVQHNERYDGFIGFDLLAGAIIEANLEQQTLRILDPVTVQPDTSKGIAVRVDLTTGQPRVPMTVAGHVPVLATLDSGNAFYVLFSRDLIAHDHVSFFQDPQSLGNRLHFYGVNGSEVDDCGKLPSLELGPISYKPVPACASYSFAHNDVLLGFDFVKAFNYVFDYPDGEILMTPR